MFIKDIQISWNLLNVHYPAYLNSELFLRRILVNNAVLRISVQKLRTRTKRPDLRLAAWERAVKFRAESQDCALAVYLRCCCFPIKIVFFLRRPIIFIHSFIHSEFETCSALCIQTINWIIRTFHKSNGETILLEQDISDKHALQRERAILVVIIRFWSLRAINVTGSGWKIQSC